MKTKVIRAMVFVALLSALVMPTFAAPPSTPPGQVITGGSFTCGTSDYSGTFVYTDPYAYYPLSFSWGGGYNTYSSQVREFFTDKNAKMITLEGSVYLKNMGEWVGPGAGGDSSGDTSYFEVGLGCINGFYFSEKPVSWPYPFKGPSCYIIIFGTSGGAGYSVHIQTQPGEWPGSGLLFPASLIDGVYEPATFKYKMTINMNSKEIYLWAMHCETGASQEITYGFSQFGWWWGLTHPSDLPGDPVFAGMISADNQDAGFYLSN
jgi:hypothetical protein